MDNTTTELDLATEVRDGLAARKGSWKRIAEALPGVSYSWISQFARGKYASQPTHARLMQVRNYLRDSSCSEPKPS